MKQYIKLACIMVFFCSCAKVTKYNEAVTAFDQKHYDQALRLANELLLDNDSSIDVLKIKAFSLFKLEQYNDAIPCLHSAIKIDTLDYSIPMYLGASYFYLGIDDMALKYLNLAYYLDNKGAGVNFYLGLYYWEQTDMDGAGIGYFQKEFDNHNNIDALSNIGQIMLNRGNVNDAISYFDRCLAMDSNYTFAYVRKAFAQAEEQNYSDALVNLETALDKSEGDTSLQYRILYYLALVSIDIEQNQAACKYLSKIPKQNLSDEAATLFREYCSYDDTEGVISPL